MSKLVEFLVVLGASAVIAAVLGLYIADMQISPEVKPWIPWGSFFAVPMIYYRLLYVSIRR